MNKKDIQRKNIKGDIKVLKNRINKYWYSWLIVSESYKKIEKLEKKLENLG